MAQVKDQNHQAESSRPIKHLDHVVDKPRGDMTIRRTKHVSGIGRISKALTGYYPRQLLALFTHYARVSGIAPGHKDYGRFIILGQERTGSTFLQSLLNSHSQITVFGEIYRCFDAIDWDYDSYRRDVPKSQLEAFQDDPISFMETHVFAKFARRISIVGFKLFYTHAQHPRQKPLWNYLIDCQELKIIHIKRKNVLRTFLSLETAKKMQKWRDLSGESVGDVSSIDLDYDDCLRKFVDTREQERKHDILFAHHEKIDQFYEDLNRDYTGEMRRVQQFLGVEYQVLTPTTHKQAKLPLSEAILNYGELKGKFKNTPWEVYFED